MNIITQCGLLISGGLLYLSFSACQKSGTTENLVTETGKEPLKTKHFLFQAPGKVKTKIMIKDRQGKLMSLEAYREQAKKGNQSLAICGSGNELDHVELYYRGFSLDNSGPCAGGLSGSVGLSWDLTLPDDLEPQRTDPSSKTMVKLTPSGWITSPSGTGERQLGYSNITLLGSFSSGTVNYKQWRITGDYTPTNHQDYCLNTFIESRFQIATSCPDFTIISSDDIYGAPIQEYYDVAVKKIVPVSFVYNASVGSTRRMEVNWGVALCTPPACKGSGYYNYSDYLEFQYQRTNGSWSIPVVRTNFLSFTVSTGTQTGLITYRYRGTMNQNDDLSDWIYGTVNVL
ncbi:MAG: hypothetical protein BGO31_09705 [Bacteroidetes bacterium 43-16]|nr:MAG: hypothetical protein BGO31_09705 [Bacteroidetes bacterium 43-16]